MVPDSDQPVGLWPTPDSKPGLVIVVAAAAGSAAATAVTRVAAAAAAASRTVCGYAWVDPFGVGDVGRALTATLAPAVSHRCWASSCYPMALLISMSCRS